MKYATAYYVKDGRSTRVTPGIKAALKYLREWYGKQPDIEFGPICLKALRGRMVDDGLNRGYVNEHVDRIKRAFAWVATEELIPATVPHSLSILPGLKAGGTEAKESKPVEPVTTDVAEATSIRKQFGIEFPQVCLGHAKPDTTLIYAEADAEAAGEGAAGSWSSFP